MLKMNLIANSLLFILLNILLFNQEKHVPIPQGGPEMVRVKGGVFQMGDVFGEGLKNEHPINTVFVEDFYMCKYEISTQEYVDFLNEMGFNKRRDPNWVNTGSSYSKIIRRGERYSAKPGMRKHPVVEVSWHGAVAYAVWLSKKAGGKYRLPTEAEWEYAAREGGRKIRFGNGENRAAPNQMNFNARQENKADYSIAGLYRAKTIEVDALGPNALGLFNMSGNVFEWCSDWYDERYYNYGPKVNPKGPDTGTERVVRGGSWGYSPSGCRNTRRCHWRPAGRYNGIGFRLVYN